MGRVHHNMSFTTIGPLLTMYLIIRCHAYAACACMRSVRTCVRTCVRTILNIQQATGPGTAAAAKSYRHFGTYGIRGCPNADSHLTELVLYSTVAVSGQRSDGKFLRSVRLNAAKTLPAAILLLEKPFARSVVTSHHTDGTQHPFWGLPGRYLSEPASNTARRDPSPREALRSLGSHIASHRRYPASLSGTAWPLPVGTCIQHCPPRSFSPGSPSLEAATISHHTLRAPSRTPQDCLAATSR